MDNSLKKNKARHAKQKTAPKRQKKNEKGAFLSLFEIKKNNGANKEKKVNKNNKSTKKPLPAKKKVLYIVLIVFVSLVLVLGGTVLYIFLDIKNAASKSHDPNFQENPYIQNIVQKDDKIYNIALFGVDSRNPESFTGRSDSMMILSIDTAEKEVKVISLMRDTLVPIKCKAGEIAGVNKDIDYVGKLNSAYAKGGPALAVKAINDNFGTDISEYATVNFYGMSDMIDAIGGIEIDVQQKEINARNGLNEAIREQAYYEGIKKPPLVTKAGKQILNGMQAVAWARIRSVSTSEGVSNDFGRTDRQRVVMETLFNKVLDKGILNCYDIAKEMFKYTKTSLDFDEMWSIATNVLFGDVSFHQTRLPQYKYIIDDGLNVPSVGSSVYFDLNFGRMILDAYIYGDISQEDYLSQNAIQKNPWYDGPVVVPQPDVPDEPSSDEPSSDEPSSDEPSSDEPSSDEPSSDEPSSDEPSSDEPSSDEPSSDEPSSDGPSSDEPSSDESSSDDSTLENEG